MVRTELTGVELESAFLAQEAIFGYERGRSELQGEVSRGRDQIAALREELVHLFREDAAAFEALVEAARREGMS